MDQPPRLVESKVKFFLKGALQHSNKTKNLYISRIYNIVLAILFFLILGGFLFYKYKGRLTPIEKEAKKRREYQHVLIQIKKLQLANQKTNGNMFTNLPVNHNLV